jgi:hypothetical protein
VVEIKTVEEMKLAGQCLERLIHGILRKMTRKCCILHRAECECISWGFPKIDYMNIPDMQKYLGGEVLNINDPHSGERRAGLKTEVQFVT